MRKITLFGLLFFAALIAALKYSGNLPKNPEEVNAERETVQKENARLAALRSAADTKPAPKEEPLPGQSEVHNGNPVLETITVMPDGTEVSTAPLQPDAPVVVTEAEEIEEEVKEAIPPPVFKSRTKGLVVVVGKEGNLDGQILEMNAVAVPTGRTRGFRMRFKRTLAGYMGGATTGSSRMLKRRHIKALPAGYELEVGYHTQRRIKDGVSSSLACGLLGTEIVTGVPLAKDFAASGDLTASGDVAGVRGVGLQLQAVAADRKHGLKFVMIPADSAEVVNDLYITGKLKAVTELQIIGVSNFDEALALAKRDRSPEILKALADYEQVKTVVLRRHQNAFNSKVQEKIQDILKVLPNHHSAKMIALHGQRKAPKTLSMTGSMNAIESGSPDLLRVLRRGGATGEFQL